MYSAGFHMHVHLPFIITGTANINYRPDAVTFLMTGSNGAVQVDGDLVAGIIMAIDQDRREIFCQ
jgi:hypothetical protein